MKDGLVPQGHEARVYRAVAAFRDPLSTEGAKRRGGRYNARGTPALYAADTGEHAAAEYLRHQSAVGLEVQSAVHCWSIDIVLVGPVLDLCDATVRADLGIDLADLLEEWTEFEDLSPPQELGERLRAMGVEAILFPSAVESEGCNIVIFKENFRNGSSITALEYAEVDRA